MRSSICLRWRSACGMLGIRAHSGDLHYVGVYSGLHGDVKRLIYRDDLDRRMDQAGRAHPVFSAGRDLGGFPVIDELSPSLAV